MRQTHAILPLRGLPSPPANPCLSLLPFFLLPTPLPLTSPYFLPLTPPLPPSFALALTSPLLPSPYLHHLPCTFLPLNSSLLLPIHPPAPPPLPSPWLPPQLTLTPQGTQDSHSRACPQGLSNVMCTYPRPPMYTLPTHVHLHPPFIPHPPKVGSGLEGLTKLVKAPKTFSRQWDNEDIHHDKGRKMPHQGGEGTWWWWWWKGEGGGEGEGWGCWRLFRPRVDGCSYECHECHAPTCLHLLLVPVSPVTRVPERDGDTRLIKARQGKTR